MFSAIEPALLANDVEAGLIIHENRFTYQDKGLVKLIDLGEYWENLTQLPIPLGGIVVKKSLDRSLQEKINRVMARSVAFALENPDSTLDFVRAHAQEMDEKVMFQHIGLYVNEYTRDLGIKGKQAIQYLFETAAAKNIIPEIPQAIFLNP